MGEEGEEKVGGEDGVEAGEEEEDVDVDEVRRKGLLRAWRGPQPPPHRLRGRPPSPPSHAAVL